MSGVAITQEHQCAGCGQQMQFDPETRGLICRGCGTQAAPVAEEVTQSQQTDGLTCPNCGANLPKAAGVVRQMICGFCDSTFSVLQDGEDCALLGEIPDNHKYIIPFSTSREAYQKGMISWLAQEKGTPVDAFDEVAMIRGAEGYYIPHYICVASYQVRWSASIGYDRIETYTVMETTTENGKTTTRPVTRTRVVTDWQPHSDTASGRVTNACPANNFLEAVYTKVEATNTKDNLEGIRDSSIGRFSQHIVSVSPTSASPVGGVAYDTKYTAGFQVMSCELPATKAYDKSFIHSQIAATITANAPGDHIRDLRFDGDIIPTYSLVYLPTWISVYTYQNRVCASHAAGTEEGFHFGTRPVDKDLKRKVKLAILPFKITGSIALLLLIILGIRVLWTYVIMERYLQISDMFYNVMLGFTGLAIMTGIIGGIIRAILYGRSRKALMQQVDAHLENPSKIFGRKSVADDPIRELTK